MPSPFDQLLDPDVNPQGSLLSVIGRLTGTPSQTGVATGDAMAAISADIAKGQSPQQAVLNYFKTPQGQDAFIKNPALLNQIKAGIDTITPPAPTITTTSPGQQAVATDRFGKTNMINDNPRNPQIVTTAPGQVSSSVDAQGNVTPVAAPETEKAQSFKAMADIAKLSPSDLQKYAEANLMVNNRYSVHAVKNAFGEDTGQFAILDNRNGTLTTTTGTASPGQNTPHALPQSFKTPSGEVDIPKLITGKSSMFLGTGFWPSVLSGLSATMGSTIHPSLGIEEGRVATQRQNYLQDLKISLTAFPQIAGRTNIVVKEMQKKVNFGIFDDPIDSVRTGIQIFDQAQGEIAANENIIKDPNQPKAEKVKASEANAGWQRVIRALPSRGEMEAMNTLLTENKIPGLGAGAGINAAKKATGRTVDTTNQEIETVKRPASNVDINTLSPAELVKLKGKTKTLSYQDQLKLKERLKQLIKQQP